MTISHYFELKWIPTFTCRKFLECNTSISLDCADGASIQISHRVTERSSLALAPVQERGGVATIAPLGTIWGSGPWHDGRLTGGQPTVG